MASYDLKAILGEKLRRLTDKTLKALVDCMCTVGASLCSLDKRVSALESEELPEGGYKPMQEPVASPSASGTAVQFIESVSQDATGRMTATKKTVRTGSTSQTGVLQLEDSHTSTSTSKAATPKNVKEAYDLANSKQSPATTIAGYGITDTYTKTEVDTFLAAKAEQVNVTNYTSFSDISAVVSAGNIPYYYHVVGSGAAKLYYQGTNVSGGIPPTVSQVYAGVFNGVLYETRFVNGASAFSAVVETPIFSAERVASSGESSSWSSDDTNVPTRAAVESKISSAMSGNIGGFMGVYSISGINYLIAFTGYNFKNGDWFSMYDSGTITYYPNNDRSSSATISVSAGDDVYWTTSGVLLVRNMSAFATKSDLSKKATGYAYEIANAKAIKITLPWSTRTGRTSFLVHYPGNSNNYAVLQISTFKSASAAMSAPKVGVVSYSTKDENSIPEVYYSNSTNSGQVIYISHSTNSNHVVTVMPTCQNIDSLMFEVVDRSEATQTTQATPSRWSTYGPKGGTSAFTARYDTSGSTPVITTFNELLDAFEWTNNIVLLHTYIGVGSQTKLRKMYRLTDVQSDSNGNYTKFVFSRTNLGEESLANVGKQEIFSCTSSGWTMTTSDIFKSQMADFATKASYYPDPDTPETPISIRESMEARLVADTPKVRVPPEPSSGERKTYLTSCLFTRLPDVSAYSNHIGTNVNYINLNDFMSWNTPSGLVKAGQVFAIWNTRSSDVRLYLGSSTSDDYMTVKAGRIGFVGTWDGMNFKLMTQ